jgi:hypothetical protein
MNRRQLALPPNGAELSEIVAKELQADLMRFFRTHLAYPNATVKIQWSASFYTAPNHYEDEVATKVVVEGVTETQLQDKGLEPQMEMSSIEVGVPSPATSPVLTRPGLPSNQLPHPVTSDGRRDIGARRGTGAGFARGQALDPNLANVGDQSAVVAKASRIVSDLEKGVDEPLHPNTITVPTAPETKE